VEANAADEEPPLAARPGSAQPRGERIAETIDDLPRSIETVLARDANKQPAAA
jgi:hypothetical protein